MESHSSTAQHTPGPEQKLAEPPNTPPEPTGPHDAPASMPRPPPQRFVINSESGGRFSLSRSFQELGTRPRSGALQPTARAVPYGDSPLPTIEERPRSSTPMPSAQGVSLRRIALKPCITVTDSLDTHTADRETHATQAPTAHSGDLPNAPPNDPKPPHALDTDTEQPLSPIEDPADLTDYLAANACLDPIFTSDLDPDTDTQRPTHNPPQGHIGQIPVASRAQATEGQYAQMPSASRSHASHADTEPDPTTPVALASQPTRTLQHSPSQDVRLRHDLSSASPSSPRAPRSVQPPPNPQATNLFAQDHHDSRAPQRGVHNARAQQTAASRPISPIARSRHSVYSPSGAAIAHSTRTQPTSHIAQSSHLHGSTQYQNNTPRYLRTVSPTPPTVPQHYYTGQSSSAQLQSTVLAHRQQARSVPRQVPTATARPPPPAAPQPSRRSAAPRPAAQRNTKSQRTDPQVNAAVRALINVIENADKDRKVKLEKFSGSALEDLEAWAERACALADEEGWTDDKLYKNAFYALKGPAFTTWKNNKEFLQRTRSFDDLMSVLRKRFLPSNEAEQAVDSFLGFSQTATESVAAFISRFKEALQRAQRAGFSDDVVALRIFMRSVHSRFARDVARLSPKDLEQAYGALRKAEELHRLPPGPDSSINFISGQESNVNLIHRQPESAHPETATQAVTTLIRAAEANNAALQQSMSQMVAQCNEAMRTSLGEVRNLIQASQQRPRTDPVVCSYCSKIGHTAEVCFSRAKLERVRRTPTPQGVHQPNTFFAHTHPLPAIHTPLSPGFSAPTPTPSLGVSRRVCTFCNKSGHSADRCFKRIGTIVCDFCNKVGHTATECYSARKHHQAHQTPVAHPHPNTTQWRPKAQRTPQFNHATSQLGTGRKAYVNAIRSRNRTPIVKVPVKVGYLETIMLWDSGAEASVADAAFVRKLSSLHLITGPSPRQPLGINPTLQGPNKVAMSSGKPVDIYFEVQGVGFFETFIVVENLGVPLIVCSDFMLMQKAHIDYEHFRLRIPELGVNIAVSAEFRTSPNEQQCKSLLLPTKPCTIAPRSHVLVTLRHSQSDPKAHATRSVYVDNRPHNLATRFLRLTPGIHLADKGEVHKVLVTNFSNKPLHLDEHSAVADAFPLTSEVVGERSVCTLDDTIHYFFDGSTPHGESESTVDIGDAQEPWLTQKEESFSNFVLGSPTESSQAHQLFHVHSETTAHTEAFLPSAHAFGKRNTFTIDTSSAGVAHTATPVSQRTTVAPQPPTPQPPTQHFRAHATKRRPLAA